MSLTKEQRKRLESSISSPLPFCSGIIPPAGFGRNKENIYDESYRKAGRLGSEFFRPMLDVKAAGLIDLIHERLLCGSKEDKVIRAELYNLNVYGEGSFFKAHVDTPRSENMFGSLVIFFPTAHEGGSLLMRKNGVEWSFDSSKVLADDGEPRLGYVALYSDVEHEVAAVTSGYRVTITYNLYFDHPSSYKLPKPLSSVSAMNNFKDELSSLLIDPEFLPQGGYLGFGLEYAYSISTSNWSKLSHLEDRLKGVDADLMQAFKELSLVTSFWSVIEYGYNLFACENRIPDSEGDSFGENRDFTDWMVADEGALVNIGINWVKDLVKAYQGEQSFINYGNESYTDHAYHNVCLIAKVGKPGTRGIPPISNEDYEDYDE
ncbi:hypothetical protein F5887DRAFT_1063351 [Amanita rubescens]|nr:hypothetical protein F5887DRAFT_1063351 [Amanita rubescens]